MKRLKAAIERRTGILFGIYKHRTPNHVVPRGTFYIRFGDGDDSLVRFECGTRNVFVYCDRVPS